MEFDKSKISQTEKKILTFERRRGVYKKNFYLNFMKKINFYKKTSRKTDEISKNEKKCFVTGLHIALHF